MEKILSLNNDTDLTMKKLRVSLSRFTLINKILDVRFTFSAIYFKLDSTWNDERLWSM